MLDLFKGDSGLFQFLIVQILWDSSSTVLLTQTIMSSHALLDIFFDKASQILKVIIYGVDSPSLSISLSLSLSSWKKLRYYDN